MDRSEGYALPVSVIRSQLEKLNRTEKENKHYWHVALLLEGAELFVNMSKTGEKFALKTFAF